MRMIHPANVNENVKANWQNIKECIVINEFIWKFYCLVSCGIQYISKLIRRWNKLAKISIFNAEKCCVCAFEKKLAKQWQTYVNGNLMRLFATAKKKAKIIGLTRITNKQYKRWTQSNDNGNCFCSAIEFWVESPFFVRFFLLCA